MVIFPKHVSIEREKELVDQIKKGSIEARNELVAVNLRYFKVINYKFGELNNLSDEETEDIFQKYVIESMLPGAEKYEPRIGKRFVNSLQPYAYRKMQAIARRDIPGFKGHIKNHPNIPFPIKKGLEDIHSTERANEKIFYQIPISETIAYQNQKTPEEILIGEELKETLQHVAKTRLNMNQTTATFNGVCQDMSLTDISQILGITRERARQLKEEGLKKLRHPSIKKTLREFL